VTVLVLFAAAIAGAVRSSLRPPGGLGPASLASWRALLGEANLGPVLGFTAWVTALTIAVAAPVALAAAMVLRRRGGLARSLFGLPVPVPHLVVASVAVLWLAQGGLAERILGVLPIQLVGNGAGLGIVAVYVYKEAPFLTLLLLAAAGEELSRREEAAAVLGAGRWQRVRWVSWPVLRGPLFVGCVISGAFTLGSFEVPRVIGPSSPTMIAEFAFRARENNLLAGQGESAAALLLAAGMAIILALVAVRFARSENDA
jgi:putative spermidine/putrescine transport system permease protein